MLTCKLCRQKRAKRFFTQKDYDLARCDQCDCVFVDNPPDRQEIIALYRFERGYHTGVLTREGDRATAMEAKRRAKIVGKRAAPGAILDIGCSSGHFLNEMKKRGWRAEGVELSPDTARIARDTYMLPVHCGDIHSYDPPAERFDVVTMWDVIEHVEDPLSELAAIDRVLKDDGLLVLYTPNVGGLFPRLSLAISGFVGRWPHPEPPHHLFQFSKTSIDFALEKTGYVMEDVQDERISLRYQIGDVRSLPKYPKRMLYWAVFSPISMIGPVIGSGDQMLVFARKA